jgi:hypothetical protein
MISFTYSETLFKQLDTTTEGGGGSKVEEEEAVEVKDNVVFTDAISVLSSTEADNTDVALLPAVTPAPKLKVGFIGVEVEGAESSAAEFTVVVVAAAVMLDFPPSTLGALIDIGGIEEVPPVTLVVLPTKPKPDDGFTVEGVS